MSNQHVQAIKLFFLFFFVFNYLSKECMEREHQKKLLLCLDCLNNLSRFTKSLHLEVSLGWTGRWGGVEGYLLPWASFPQGKYFRETACSPGEGTTSCEFGRWRSRRQEVLGQCHSSTCLNSPQLPRPTATSTGAISTQKPYRGY